MSVLVVTVILCCVVFGWWRFKPRHRSPPPLPGALPLIGHLHKFVGDSKHLWNYIREIQMYSLKKGGLCELWFGPHTIYVLTDPEDSVTLANSCLSKPYIYHFAKDYIKNGLITAEASIWKIHRKLLNPAFNQQVLNTYVDEMNMQARYLTSQLDLKVGNDPFDVGKYFIHFTISSTARTSLGFKTQSNHTSKEAEYAETLQNLCALYCARFQKWWLHVSYVFNWSPLKRKQDQLTNKLKNISNQVINKGKSELKDKKNTMSDDSLPDKFKPVLYRLLHLAEEQDTFTDDDIREHLDTLVAAAFDTTSSALTIILLLIGSHQDVQDRIFNELQEVFEDKNYDLTKQDLPKLVYLDAVIKESMRMYPVVPIIGRKVDKDVHLKNYTLRAGSSCGIGVYGLLHHPMWGPDVEQFRPERWLENASLTEHQSWNAAFSVGKRNCIGKVYSMMLMKTALAHIVRRYHVTGDINKVVWELEIVLKPVEGHHIGLTLRT